MKKNIAIHQVLVIAGILLGSLWAPALVGESRVTTPAEPPQPTNVTIDVPYIYNITAALSHIVFSCYNTSQGEIAKGRAYGSKGEHKAMEILYENMTSLGLHPQLEQLAVRPGVKHDTLVTILDVLNYDVKLNGKTLDCFIAPSWKGPQGTPDELNSTFSYRGLRVLPYPAHPCLYNRSIAQMTDDFLFLKHDQWNDPNGSFPLIHFLKPFLPPLKYYLLSRVSSLVVILRDTAFWYRMYPHCKGLLLQDFNRECHDCGMLPENGNSLPLIFITGNDGDRIRADMTGSRVDLTLTQHLNTSVISYNVIGELKGHDEKQVVILSCLYDGWWDQGTADAAIGMAMVLAIAKYIIQQGITPEYTLKFIGFSGEEYGLLGARYYEATHKNESIRAVIDLNQVGFTQYTPRLTLDFVSNRFFFLRHIWDIVQRTNYRARTGNVTDITKVWWPSGSIPGNSGAFSESRPGVTVLTVFKDGGWTLHHRDGNNHSVGDVLSLFNWTDTAVTAEIMYNITLACVMKQQDSIMDPMVYQAHDPVGKEDES